MAISIKKFWAGILGAAVMLATVTVLAGNNSGAAFSTWPDTGQGKCYDNSDEIPCPTEGEPFYGQDARYDGPTRSYTKLDNQGNNLPASATSFAMVRDDATGLTWEMKEVMDSIADYNNPHDSDNIYSWCDNNLETNKLHPYR